jgi:hypothetical protein
MGGREVVDRVHAGDVYDTAAADGSALQDKQSQRKTQPEEDNQQLGPVFPDGESKVIGTLEAVSYAL